ncbi:glucoamylase family protein [Rhodanobacter sp. MP7CTX1]|uniref:glucoamylase family protein n=1 Tax=Rhodanobacter sp. MP7CTX1 TaxID=2723084 RepID=UPI001619DE90|nr:glucoamylase family protein [Rhodanobacter sp. MP7CTX1]MBB6185984.1 hypothetical protein [Rhodanobacter sp. MP7CTX1]
MNQPPESVDQKLQNIQQKAFSYFRREFNPVNGLIIDKTAPDGGTSGWPASIAAVGFALASYPVAVVRAFLPRLEAVQRTLTTLRFFSQSAQGPEPDATGYRGFYYHFLDMQTGRRAWQCELSIIDTSLLLAGMLTCARFFDGNTPEESEIRSIADALYRRVEWDWALDSDSTVSMGWRPESGFLGPCWKGYNEALLLYLLALGSPTHPISAGSYRVWMSGYQWKQIYGQEYLYAGALFTHQFPHIWVDFRGIQDAFMRDKGIDYFENSRRATYVQRQYAIANPLGFAGYGPNCWGLTACQGPGPDTVLIDGIERQFFNYVARGAPYGPDDGTISPSTVVASLPFAPEIVLPAIDHFVDELQLHDVNPYGFRATINPTYHTKGNGIAGWISHWHYGINQGPALLMVENHRSGLLWKLMRECPYLIRGLKRAGFSGGWL